MTTERNEKLSDAEILAAIKGWHEYGAGLVKEDIDWLIEQPARLKELKATLKSVQEQLITVRGMNRYHDNEITGLCIQISQALAGESNGQRKA